MSEFHAEAPQATASEVLAQGPYMAATAGFKPMTLRTKGAESANEPPLPTTLGEFGIKRENDWQSVSHAIHSVACLLLFFL